MKRTREEEKNHYFFFCLSLNCTHCCCCFPFLHIRLQFFFFSFVFCCCWPECSLIDYNSVWGERWAGDNNLRNVNMKRENVECSHGSHIYMREKSIELYVYMMKWSEKIDRKKETNRWLMGSCGHVCVCLYNNRITRRSKKMWTDRDKMYVGFYTFFFFILLLSEPTQHTAYTQRARGTWLNPIQRVPVSHSVWLLFFCCVCYLNDVVFWNCLCGVSLWRVNIA